MDSSHHCRGLEANGGSQRTSEVAQLAVDEVSARMVLRGRGQAKPNVGWSVVSGTWVVDVGGDKGANHNGSVCEGGAALRRGRVEVVAIVAGRI